MKYGKHLISTIGIEQPNTYFRHFAGHLACSYNFRGYNRPRKLKTANIYPHVFEAKTRKFGDAKIFHFTVFLRTLFILCHIFLFGCWMFSKPGSKLFAKVISRQKKSSLACKNNLLILLFGCIFGKYNFISWLQLFPFG